MNAFVKFHKVLDEGVKSLWQCESHIQSLSTLGIKMENYGALVSTLVLEKLSHDVKLIINRIVKKNTWVLAKILKLINQELRARWPDKIQDGKNGAIFDLPYTGSSLHPSSHHPRYHSSSNSPGKRVPVKCAFCQAAHWSYKCSVISDFGTRNEFLKREKRCFLCLRQDHTSRNCSKTKPCFYCKGMHNSSICSRREISKTKQETKTGIPNSTNYASNVSSVLLQTADILLENPVNKKQVRTKVLFDQGVITKTRNRK